MTSRDVKAPEAHPTLTTHPLLGVAGVLRSAMIAACFGRLMSVGWVDIRGALRLGVDEASWINTSFNASMMFIGQLSVYLGGLLGAVCWVACLFVVAFTSTVPTQYGQVVAAPVEAK